MNRQEFEEYIEHFGKKGMKWGVRKQFSAKNRALNKASRKKDAEKQLAEVTKARADTKSPTFWKNTSKSNLQLKKAKSQHNANKEKLGSREAAKILNKAREKRANTLSKSREAKNGKERATRMLSTATIELAKIYLSKGSAGGAPKKGKVFSDKEAIRKTEAFLKKNPRG